MPSDKGPWEPEEIKAEEALPELREMRVRYAIPESQRLCVGYSGGCDGDLEGTAHEATCPAYTRDRELRPHLYADDSSVVADSSNKGSH